MLATFHIPHHSDWLSSSPVLGFSSIFIIDGGTAVQSQSSGKESPVNTRNSGGLLTEDHV